MSIILQEVTLPPMEVGSSTIPTPYSNFTNEPRDELDLSYYLPLHQAVKNGNWETAKRFNESDPNALTAVISLHKMTALHVASCSGRWQFVEKLVKLMPTEAIAMQENRGRTALHFAAISGTKKAVRTLVTKNNDLTQIVDAHGQTPLFMAPSLAPPELKDVVWYLSLVTRDENEKAERKPFSGHLGADLILSITASGYYDICLHLIQRYPHLATARDKNNSSILHILSQNPSAFPSGSRFGFWKSCIYPLLPVQLNHGPQHPIQSDMESPFGNLRESGKVPTSTPSATFLSQAPGIKCVYAEKWRHKHVLELVECICRQAVKDMCNTQVIDFFIASEVLNTATSVGIVEIIERCLKFFPDLIWTPVSQKGLINVAVECRQEKIVNCLFEKYRFSAPIVIDCSSILHVVAKLAPSSRLNSVSGSAFQMQRELHWFKMAENLVHPSFRAAKNSNGKTAQEIFTEEHADLREKGERWMKDTSNSCMVVSTLIATVAFAAAFTVPGGNSDKGFPIFLMSNSFMVFVISDALALFSSTNSILIFLSMLTSRYAEEDFLHSLPKRLIIGLASFFFSIATMMIAFGAAISMVVGERLRWGVSVPVIACVPVTLFAALQLPLFIQMVKSTYGPGIFHIQKLMIDRP
ncbi:uncharacterized protein LOC132277051 [Cornus florida]|uniref:uncharacterized protein LOC132277051 n=1 Tax=Cornus florida TaxID=4283 RepID=UPI0028965503|nr:uncharacterized protein LOC132277051 [Cornus florida]